jgi:hypothetical protein
MRTIIFSKKTKGDALTKAQTQARPAPGGKTNPEQGTIGFLAVTSIGIGGMVGGGIFAVLNIIWTINCPWDGFPTPIQAAENRGWKSLPQKLARTAKF